MFDLIGKTVGPYRVLEQIGIGGMAVVYKAYHPSMDRYVAFKVLPPHLSKDIEFIRRFQREARAIARLEHAHILPIHDYGEYEGVTYIVMRYVEAGTLRDRMAAGLLSLDEVNRLINQIGSALDYAHRMGIIHRDVKPGNVLIDHQGDTYLSDFGLARMMEPTQQLTASGVGLGTPAYMSPEQGQGVKVDHRSDVYSLGVILYEMLTGRVPYEAETPMAVVLKHINDELPLPHAVNPDVPEPVERVVLKALAKDPADRYQTAGEMVGALAVAIHEASKEPPIQIAPSLTKPRPARENVSLITRIHQAWAQPLGKVMLAGSMIVVLVAFGLLLSRLPGQIAIVESGAGITATLEILPQPQISSPTAELSAATRVPTTEAPGPQTEQIRAFAEPILQAIADRPPDFEDDFSTANKGWQWHEDMRDQVKITDGMMQVDGTGGGGIWHELLLRRNDFVLEFDTRQETPGSMGTFFRLQDPDIWHSIEVSSDTGSWVINQYEGQRLQGYENVLALGEVNRITLIARDNQFAVYINGKPTAYFENASILNASGVQLSFWGLSEPPYEPSRASRMQGEYDNLKVWDISDLPSSVSTVAGNLSWEQVYDNSIFQRADVSAVAVDPKNPNVIYAATSGGLSFGAGAGIYKSVDGGETWVAVNDGLDHISVSGVFIDPDDTQIVYATTFGAGPYKSTDGGAHWKPINVGLINLTGTDNGVSSFVFDPADPSRLYHADPYEGVFRSTDGGETWQFVIQPCQSYLSLAIDPRDGNHLFAGAWPNDTCPGGLFESTDGGLNWVPIAQNIPDIEKAVVRGIVLDPSVPESMYAHVDYPGLNQPGGLFGSTNGGKDWSALRTTGSITAINPDKSGNLYVADGIELHSSDDGGRTWTTLRGGFGGRIGALTFSGDTLYVGATGVYWTRNGGQSWETSGSGFGSTWLELTFDPSGNTLYAEDNDCALYRSQDDGAAWESVRSPGCGLAFDSENSLLYRIGTHTLHSSTDGGRTWSDSSASGDSYRVYVNPTDANTLYTLDSCCSPNPYIHQSTDGGQTWKPLPNLNDLYHGRMVIADDGSRIYVASGAVNASDDQGESWRACQTTTNNNGNPPALAVHPQDSSIVLLGTWGTGVLKSTNACETWSTANAGLANLYVNTLVFDPRDPNIVYAGTDGGVFLSQDGGDSWSAVDDGLGRNLSVYSIAIDPNDSSRVFTVTPDGVYRLMKIPD